MLSQKSRQETERVIGYWISFSSSLLLHDASPTIFREYHYHNTRSSPPLPSFGKNVEGGSANCIPVGYLA